MTENDKPAASANAAGSEKMRNAGQAARGEHSPSFHRVQRRARALRFMLDMLVRGADEAPTRASELALREAAARVGDAVAYERRAACGRRA